MESTYYHNLNRMVSKTRIKHSGLTLISSDTSYHVFDTCFWVVICSSGRLFNKYEFTTLKTITVVFTLSKLINIKISLKFSPIRTDSMYLSFFILFFFIIIVIYVCFCFFPSSFFSWGICFKSSIVFLYYFYLNLIS